jgi:predicted RNA binding protein YcfA (HicA-like mRNA interferase family)
MGHSYPPLTRFQVEDILKNLGFVPKNQEGSHTQWEGLTKGLRRIVTVKKLRRDTDVYDHKLLRYMILQSGLNKKEFYSHL